MKKIILLIGLIVMILIVLSGCKSYNKFVKESDCQMEQAKGLCEHYGYDFIQVTMGGVVSCRTDWNERIDYNIRWDCK